MTHEESWILFERKHVRKETIIKIFNLPGEPPMDHIPDYINEE
jgi:hypothetical protein